jgi:MFS family permease
MRLAFNRNLKLIFAAQALSAVGNGLLMPLLPPYFLRLGLTGGDVGALGGIMELSMTVALLPSADLADARGRKPLALASAALSAAATLLAAARPQLFRPPSSAGSVLYNVRTILYSFL